MNAKKIMGAVLVALLAAALFVGAGAADPTDKGIVYTYTDLTSLLGINSVQAFSAEDGSASIMTQEIESGKYGFALSESQYKAGIYYTNGTIKFKVAAPTAIIAITDDGESIVGGTINDADIETGNPTFTPGTPLAGTLGDMIFITPDGAEVKLGSGQEFKDIKALGKWGVKVAFGNTVLTGGPEYSEPVYFTVVDETSEPTISANKDAVITGNVVLITVNKAGTITYNKELFTPVANQVGTTDSDDNGEFVVDQKGSYAFKADMIEGDATFSFDFTPATGKAAEVDVTVEAGEITAAAEFDSYYIGQDIKLEGTNTVGLPLFIYIKGTNFEFNQIAANVAAKAEWSKKILASAIEDAEGKKPDAGSYTIYVSTVDDVNEKVVTGDGAVYTTAVIALKQPFISVTSAPSVVVKGDKLVIEGTAESAKQVWLYIFGTNYFFNTTVGVKDSKFKIEEKIGDDVAPGQYFAVIQHPMYDEDFNIAPFGKDIYLNTTSNDAQLGKGSILFNVDARQTANAAQALCDALDTENIDDMYVKLSYIVANGVSVINPIPSEVTQGSKLTVSGKTNGGAGTIVTVEMMSTAFAAVPKDTVGSASFISLTTKTDKDGNWEVTFDTTGLNVDEYTVTAAVAQYETTATAVVNVVEAADTPDTPDTPDVPDTPDTPDTPTEPETPGFGALAALAGLGAVAVLLLRRE